MGILSWIIPQEKHFFDMIEKQSSNVVEGVNALLDMLENYEDIEAKRENIKKIEKENDNAPLRRGPSPCSTCPP